ncbi:DUF3048 domain-containing protein [Evansella sp. AB-P1]|uniref:DUF3048 domain-containing protein n=1 Tax=Evansella sp. AB-P1 TaxID=3037653 RepID=UPI00241C30AF|nr:DUF3048 domain-containing protein [Evansella sp. AB-P1]MDG5785943.1 DUF3048 domain-containing protein [Evansella sp. AB-P1]
MKLARNLLIVALILSLTVLVACRSSNEASTNNNHNNEPDNLIENENEEEEIEPIEEEVEPTVRYPLTGLGAEEGTDIDYRAFGVMIENSNPARPHSGLYQADIVYEILSEYTITRFLALYHSQKPERIGPLRSARAYYVHLNRGFDAIYAHFGGSPGGVELAGSDYVDNIDGRFYEGRFFSRSTDRVAPHNAYTTYDDLLAGAEQIGYEMNRRPPELYFADELEAEESEAVTRVEINYGSQIDSVQFEYDEERKAYHRFNGGQASIDQETGEPVAPKNVFIIETSHRVIPKGENHVDAGSNRREIDITSGGRGYLIQEGFVQEVEWKNEDGIILPYKDGELVPFLRGQTWINVVPSGNGGMETNVTLLNENE